MLDVTDGTRLTMKYEAPVSLPDANVAGLLARTGDSDHSARREGWRGRCPGSLYRSDPAMDADEGRPIRAGDLEDVRAGTAGGSRPVGRFYRRTNLQSVKCRSFLWTWQCGQRSTSLLTGPACSRIVLYFGLL